MAVLLSYIYHLSYEILKYSVWYSWKNGHLGSGITMSWPANQSDAKLLEGGVVESVTLIYGMCFLCHCNYADFARCPMLASVGKGNWLQMIYVSKLTNSSKRPGNCEKCHLKHTLLWFFCMKSPLGGFCYNHWIPDVCISTPCDRSA